MEGDLDTTCSLWLEVDVGRVLVQPDAHSVKFCLEQCSLLSSLRCVKNHKNHITRLVVVSKACPVRRILATISEKARQTNLRRRNNLPTTTLALRSALNNTRQIEDLNLGTSILEHTGDGCERGERVRGDFRLGLRDLGQEGRFSDGRETHQGDAGIA